MRALLDALGAHESRWDFSTSHPWPPKFYSTSVADELVQTLSQFQGTSQGLPILKPFSNFVLSVTWITRPATDLRLSRNIYSEHLINVSHPAKVLLKVFAILFEMLSASCEGVLKILQM